MKKKILAICLISALALTACGRNNSAADASTDNDITTEYSNEADETTSEVTDESTSMVESSETMEDESVMESSEAEEATESSEEAEVSTEETKESIEETKEPSKSTESSKESNKTSEAVKPSESTKPSANTKPSESTKPSASTPSVENKPSTPPVEESKPSEPSEPTAPSESSKPSEPSAPSVTVCNHTYTVEEVASTCTVAGHRKEYCTKCNDVKSDETLALADHNVQTNILIPGTCSNGEESEGRCTVCNTRVWYLASQFGKYGDHKFTDKRRVLEPTCNLQGGYSYYCVYCGERNPGMDEDIPATGLHTPSGSYVIATAPTCTTNGTERDHCTGCGVALDETIRSIPKLGHVDSDGDHFCDRCDVIW